MAVTYNTSYYSIGNREGLTDVIADLFADDTPFYSMCEKVNATNRKHEWQEDALASATRAGVVEGLALTYAATTPRTRLYNYTQIRLRNWDVSFTQLAIVKAGIKDDIAREVMKAMKSIGTDYEKMLLSTGDRTVGTTAIARESRGLLKAIASNTGLSSGGAKATTSYAQLTEDMVNARLQEIWDAGGNPRALFCGGHQKRVISKKFSAKTGFTFNIEASTRQAIANINKYEGAFGTVDIIPDRHIETKHLAIVTPEMCKVAVLRDIQQYKGAATGSSIKGWVEGEMCLQWGNEKAHAEHSMLKASGAIA
jgi:hypothetical protein